MAGGDDDYFSVVDAAFERSELPRAPASQESPLGCSPWDLYIFRLLQLAGIVVEMVGRPALEGEEPPRLHESMQIVPTFIMQDTLANRNKDEIKFCNQLKAPGTSAVDPTLSGAVRSRLSRGTRWYQPHAKATCGR